MSEREKEAAGAQSTDSWEMKETTGVTGEFTKLKLTNQHVITVLCNLNKN